VYEYGLIPLAVKDDVLLVAVPSPDLIWPETEIKNIAQLRDIRSVLSTPEAIHDAIYRYYGPEGLVAA